MDIIKIFQIVTDSLGNSSVEINVPDWIGFLIIIIIIILFIKIINWLKHKIKKMETIKTIDVGFGHLTTNGKTFIDINDLIHIINKMLISNLRCGTNFSLEELKHILEENKI